MFSPVLMRAPSIVCASGHLLTQQHDNACVPICRSAHALSLLWCRARTRRSWTSWPTRSSSMYCAGRGNVRSW